MQDLTQTLSKGEGFKSKGIKKAAFFGGSSFK